MAEDDRPAPLVIQSPAQFKALGHPLRHRVVNMLRQRPATLRQLAEALGLAKGTIGYHVRVLREAGLVELAESRQVRGGTEQYFGLINKSFAFREGETLAAAFLYNSALAEMRPAPSGQPEHTELRHLWLTPEQAASIADQLREHVAELQKFGVRAAQLGAGESPTAQAYGMLVSLFPADVPRLGPDDVG
ncbi:transcriptional regulator [Kitasatospora sp. MMS16-BH015]|uniref:winged helix-turn-helix domain-containing protein n=1 Tax=Kitasatospora sp. MMS16-BH015 TaxID=2018025 RepID=UPI000CA3A921|nr:winged helix-turn-helix domain-containing protein [Kitasatospora sp. MMS16-BH015]AUG76923.1 transcriptional regulator [Kitasatospora sp. MMS16-BH015]